MNIKQLTLYIAIAVGLAGHAIGAGQKTPGYLVTFHLEGEETDLQQTVTPVKLGSEAKQYVFQKMPSFSDKDIAWYHPFQSDDGVTFGVAFRLHDFAATKLSDLTIANQGKLLGMRAVNAPLKVVRIDRPVNDGIIVMWGGLTREHLAVLNTKFTHVDQYRGVSNGEPSFVNSSSKPKGLKLFGKNKETSPQSTTSSGQVEMPTQKKARGLFDGLKKNRDTPTQPTNPYANPR